MRLGKEDFMAIWGYVRVSTHDQTPETQKLMILEYANQHHLMVEHWIETTMSSRKSPHARRIDELLAQVKPHDTVIVSELSRLGRSVGQIAMIVDALLTTSVSLISLKEHMVLGTHLTLQKKVMMTMFSLF
jgi:DNA invertase Pin-like site-specific DNA recombinase